MTENKGTCWGRIIREASPEEVIMLRPEGKWTRQSVGREGGNIPEEGAACAEVLGMELWHSGGTEGRPV